MQELYFLYLIASGNNDSVYKVGISADPNARLRQVKATYNIPKAYIVETMDVKSRSEVFALEAALHAKLEDRRVTRYGGREFFELSQSDLAWLRSLYKDNSNDFAQAKAYYGLELAAAELMSKAQVLEADRQRKISHNRRHGKIHDTKPSGDLKRYNDLKEKLQKGYLGERFQIRSYSHPALKLSNKVQSKVDAIIAQKSRLNFLKVCAIGLFSGALTGATKGADLIAPTAILGGAIGFFSGVISQSARGSQERSKAKLLVESEIDARYPAMRDKKMTVLEDLKGGNSFLIKDYGELAPSLRNSRAVHPSASLPSQDKIYTAFENKSYFPKVATTITVGIMIGIGVGGNGQDASPQKEIEHPTQEQYSQAEAKTDFNQYAQAHLQAAIKREAGEGVPRGQLQMINDPNLIHREFKADNAGTLTKYNGKAYKVTGIVDNRTDDRIKVDSQTLFGGAVYCYYLNAEERQKAFLLQRNQVITLSGQLELTPRSSRRLRVNVLDCSLNT